MLWPRPPAWPTYRDIGSSGLCYIIAESIRFAPSAFRPYYILLGTNNTRKEKRRTGMGIFLPEINTRNAYYQCNYMYYTYLLPFTTMTDEHSGCVMNGGQIWWGTGPGGCEPLQHASPLSIDRQSRKSFRNNNSA